MVERGAGAEDPAGERRQGVGSIIHAIKVLRHLSEIDEPQGVTAIAKDLGISPSSCFNIVRTLVSEGLLDFDPRRKTYNLGLGTVELAHRALSRSDIFPFVRQKMERLATERDMTVVLWRVAQRRHLVVVGAAEPSAGMQVAVSVGYRLPLLSGASGRCVAAFGNFTATELETELGRIQQHDASDTASYIAGLEEVRTKGWAIDQGHFRSGLTAVAAPVIDNRGAVTYALSAIMFSTGQTKDKLDEIGGALKQIAGFAS